MLNRSKRTRQNRKALKPTPLGVEQLETRLMNAADGIHQNLQLMLTPNSVGSTQLVSNANTAPTIQTQAKLATGTQVTGTFANLMVLAADRQGESGLTYSWSVVSRPSGATPSFTINDTNQAKNTRVDFNKAGVYEFQVEVRDSGGLSTVSKLRVNVSQTVTTLSLATSQGANIDSELTVSGSTQRIVVKGTDQFGTAMASVPGVTWTRVSGPNGANPTAAIGSKESVLTFNKLGQHTLRVKSGSATIDLKTSVVQVLTTIEVQDANRRVLTGGATVNTAGSSLAWTAIGKDQFGGLMVSQPVIEWGVGSAPRGANTSLEASSSKVTIGFNRVGTYGIVAKSGVAFTRVSVAIAPTLTRIELLAPDGSIASAQSAIETSTTSQRLTVRGLDQFDQPMTSIPSLTWSTAAAPSGGSATGTLNKGVASIAFSSAGLYTIRVKHGIAQTDFKVSVVRTLSSIVAFDSQRVSVSSSSPVKTDATLTNVTLQGLDQFGKVMTSAPAVTWTTVTAPSQGTATVETSKGVAKITFTGAGNYALRATLDKLIVNVPFQVAQRLSGISVSSTVTELATRASTKFQVTGVDQFGNSMNAKTGINWSATGGTINSQGVFTAGTQTGNFTVTARAGTFSAQSPIKVVTAVTPSPTPTPTPTPTPSPTPSPTVSAVRSLANTLHSDNSITRAEMIQLLRSAGSDGSVSQTELDDLRWVVSTSSQLYMPAFVRELAKDVVNSNSANLRYKGQSAGNLTAGSSGTHLNSLVDKWFMGADEPTIVGAGISYQTATGNLFNGTPSRNDGRQGYLGDCYFIASLTSIADRTASAVQNMFLDNGDGTFTIRFYASSGADYVTVNRRLPTLSNGTLAYSGLGLSATSGTTSLWVAMAEKAYAQWNETGNAGRDGTNTYAGIEGGWMSYVNKQVLGYDSSNHNVATTTKQQLVDFLAEGKAVTIGTKTSVASGWVGGHAYIVTGYNAGTDMFDLYNPWGFSHAGTVNWSQIQSNCDFYAVTNSTGTSAISTASVRSAMSETVLGNWTTIETVVDSVERSSNGQNDVIEWRDEETSLSHADSIHEWVTPAETYVSQAEEVADEDRILDDLHVLATDLAFAVDFESLFA